MQYVDLTHELDPEVPVYPGDDHFSFRPRATLDVDGCNARTMTIGSHTGTHIDAPFHFFPDGKTIEQIPLSDLIGPAVVVDLSLKNLKPREQITWGDLEPYASKMQPRAIVLIHTGWWKHWKTPEYFHHPYLSESVAQGLLDSGIRVVGVDTLNPDETPIDSVGGENGFKFHEVFLGAGGIIAENLANLSQLIDANQKVDNDWIVSLIPLNIRGSDGSPVRAFAHQSL